LSDLKEENARLKKFIAQLTENVAPLPSTSSVSFAAASMTIHDNNHESEIMEEDEEGMMTDIPLCSRRSSAMSFDDDDDDDDSNLPEIGGHNDNDESNVAGNDGSLTNANSTSAQISPQAQHDTPEKVFAAQSQAADDQSGEMDLSASNSNDLGTSSSSNQLSQEKAEVEAELEWMAGKLLHTNCCLVDAMNQCLEFRHLVRELKAQLAQAKLERVGVRIDESGSPPIHSLTQQV
jgi:hypothetical protein